MVSPKKRIWIALIPVAVLVAVLSMDISVFGADSILGTSQGAPPPEILKKIRKKFAETKNSCTFAIPNGIGAVVQLV